VRVGVAGVAATIAGMDVHLRILTAEEIKQVKEVKEAGRAEKREEQRWIFIGTLRQRTDAGNSFDFPRRTRLP